MDAFELDDLISALDTSRHDFAESFRAERLSLTIAFWPAGSVDDQTPHTEDEVYCIASGRGQIHVAGEDSPVRPGSIVYVAAGAQHRFHSIEEDLQVPVFWAPLRHFLA